MQRKFRFLGSFADFVPFVVSQALHHVYVLSCCLFIWGHLVCILYLHAIVVILRLYCALLFAFWCILNDASSYIAKATSQTKGAAGIAVPLIPPVAAVPPQANFSGNARNTLGLKTLLVA